MSEILYNNALAGLLLIIIGALITRYMNGIEKRIDTIDMRLVRINTFLLGFKIPECGEKCPHRLPK